MKTPRTHPPTVQLRRLGRRGSINGYEVKRTDLKLDHAAEFCRAMFEHYTNIWLPRGTRLPVRIHVKTLLGASGILHRDEPLDAIIRRNRKWIRLEDSKGDHLVSIDCIAFQRLTGVSLEDGEFASVRFYFELMAAP